MLSSNICVLTEKLPKRGNWLPGGYLNLSNKIINLSPVTSSYPKNIHHNQGNTTGIIDKIGVWTGSI